MKRIISESGFARINRILQGDVGNINTYAILTGENPCGCKLSKKENKEMNDRMESMIRARGYGFHKIGGNFFKNEEHSVMVPNMSREDAIELGERLKQYSVIFGSKNVTAQGRIFMKHQMLRTYCDDECKKTPRWDKKSLNQKLRGLKPLTKAEVGTVESERNVSITDRDVHSKITDYSYVDTDKRRFSIPFYNDPKASSYPSREYGKNIVPYQFDLTRGEELSTKEKFAFMDTQDSMEFEEMPLSDIDMSDEDKEYLEIQYGESHIRDTIKKILKEHF
jgi:hypothetical protein